MFLIPAVAVAEYSDVFDCLSDFHVLDLDASGELTFPEIQTSRCFEVAIGAIDIVIVYDVDGNGSLSQAEWAAFCTDSF